MALRPVSELGLVAVTDVPGGSPAPASSRAGTKPAAPARARAGAREAATRDEMPGTAGTRVATSVLSGAIGVAGALVLGRAILRR